MEKERSSIIAFLIMLMILGWGLIILNISSSQTTLEEQISQAEMLFQKGLYQKSINAYKKALEVEENRNLRDGMILATLKSYEEGTTTKSEYTNELINVCTLYPEEPVYWEQLIEFYYDKKNIKDAYKYWNKSVDKGVTSEKLVELGYLINYSFSRGSEVYSEVRYSTYHNYSMTNGKFWGMLDYKGETDGCESLYVGPISEDGLHVINDENLGCYVIDENGVIQARFKNAIEECKAIGSELIPVKNEDEKWKYINFEEEKVLGDYEDATSFMDDVAYVYIGEKWKAINSMGEFISENTFDEIKLYGSGEFKYRGIMIAKNNNLYGIYDQLGNRRNDFSAIDMDIYLGSYIAFKDNRGLWGFVDKDGQVIIEPQYKEAKSFSGKLAAVKKGDKWGFIDENNNLVIQPQFFEAEYFSGNGAAMVGLEEENYYMIKLNYPKN